jgi:hypothetical protein
MTYPRVNNPLCNPDLAACTIATNPIFYDQSLPAPTDVPQGMQAVPVPSAYIEAIRFSAYSAQNYYDKDGINRARNDGAQTPNATDGYYIAGLDKSSEDLSVETQGFLADQAAEEEAYLRNNFTAGADYRLKDIYYSLPSGLRPSQKYIDWYFSVQMVQDVNEWGQPIESPIIVLSRTPQNRSTRPTGMQSLNNGRFLYASSGDDLSSAYIVDGITSVYDPSNGGVPSLNDDRFYAEPVATNGMTPILAVVDYPNLFGRIPAASGGWSNDDILVGSDATDDASFGTGVRLSMDDDHSAAGLGGAVAANHYDLGAGSLWDWKRPMVAGGFLSFSPTEAGQNLLRTVGPYARSVAVNAGIPLALYGIGYAHTRGMEKLLNDKFGISDYYTKKLRPITQPLFTVADTWALSESTVWLNKVSPWLQSNISSRIPTVPAMRPNWAELRKVGPGMVAVGKITDYGMNKLGDWTGIDTLKRGGAVNFVGSMLAPVAVWKYGSRVPFLAASYKWTLGESATISESALAARFPGILKWSPVKIAGDAIAALTVADIFTGIGESFRSDMPWYDAGDKLDDFLFNNANHGRCDDAFFPSLCWKYDQLATRWRSNDEEGKVFDKMEKSVNSDFPQQMRDHVLPIMALNDLVGDDGSGRLVLDWVSYRKGLKDLRESDVVQSVYGYLKMMNDAKNTYDSGSDEYQLLDVSTWSGLKMQGVLNENMSREEMRDYVKGLLDRNDLSTVLQEAVSVQYRKLAKLNVDAGLAMGIELSQSSHLGNPAVSVKISFAQGGTDVKLQNSDTYECGTPRDPNSYGDTCYGDRALFQDQKFELKAQDGVVFARTTTPDGLIHTDMTAAWDESKKKFMITTQTTKDNGEVINPMQVTYSNYAMLPLPIPHVREKTQQEMQELDADGDGRVDDAYRMDKSVYEWKTARLEVLKTRMTLLTGGQAELRQKMDFLESLAKAIDPSNPDAEKNRQAFIDAIDFDTTLNDEGPAPEIAVDPVVEAYTCNDVDDDCDSQVD